MTASTDTLILAAVVGGRLLLPLFIPRWPLPAILACLLLDGVDQTIFQQWTTLDLTWYQGYDKALDIYYLTIAYISTMRNWTNLGAFRVSQFLFYYRLVGVVLFEFTQIRTLLFIFPNTFEYFFIFYEAVRTRYNPLRFSTRFWVLGAAAIWIFIKLPQEYIIHIAQVDTTDWIKMNVFGVAPTASFGEAFANRPGVTLLLVGSALLLVGLAWWLLKKAPPADYRFRLKSDPPPRFATDERGRIVTDMADEPFFSWSLLEKIVLVTFVSLIFSSGIPGLTVNPVSLAVGIILIVAANAGVSQVFGRRGMEWGSFLVQFIAVALTNLGIAIFLSWFLPARSGGLGAVDFVFFLLLLSLIVALYDRYRPAYRARHVLRME